MADRGKYVVVKHWVCDMMPIVFPMVIEHSDFIGKMGLKPEDIDSAGFVSFGVDESGKQCVRCYGNSNSLKLEAQLDRDSKLCTRLFLDPFWDD